MDALKQILHAIRLKPQVFHYQSLPCELKASDCAAYHVVESGCCELQIGDKALTLQTGDLVVVSNTQHYCLNPLDAATRLVSGEFRADHNIVYPLFSLLPPLIFVENQDGEPIYWLGAALVGITLELQGQRPGYEAVISRLIDILFIMVMRSWIDQQPEGGGGWLGALYDPHVGKSLNAIHGQPEKPWTLSRLAEISALSRSAFAQRFMMMVGESPMKYLTRWRIQLAMTWLNDDPTLTLEYIAQRVGYSTSFAFSKAFKRLTGVSPSAYREH